MALTDIDHDHLRDSANATEESELTLRRIEALLQQQVEDHKWQMDRIWKKVDNIAAMANWCAGAALVYLLRLVWLWWR